MPCCRARLALLAGVTLLALWPALLISQAGSPQSPRFFGSTQAVQLDVTVRDRAGTHVRDLTLDDFEVFEDNVRCRLISVEARDDGGPSPMPDSPGRDTACRDCPVSDGQTVVAIVFHQLTPQSRVEAVTAVRDSLAMLTESQFVALFSLDSALTQQSPFTRDQAVLRRGLDQVAMRPPVIPPSSSSLTEAAGFPGAGGSSASEEVMGAMRSRMQGDALFAEQRAIVDSRSLSALVDELAGYAGRRVVLLLSEGLAISPRLTSTGQLARAQNVGFYTIDATGFTGERGVRSELASWLTFDSVSRFDPKARLQYHDLDATRGLGPLAGWTGGLHLAGTNDLRAAISRAVSDWRPYYLLSYHAPAGPPAKEPKIEIKITRPGLAVHARQLRRGQ